LPIPSRRPTVVGVEALRLAARRLTKRFGERTAVDNVTFEVRAGESVGLLGPNGAGKTTTISMLTGLIRPTSGEVEIEGSPLTGDTDPAKRRLGLAPQELALYETLSARENLRFFSSLYGLSGSHRTAAIETALKFVDLAGRADEPVQQFSGGMKRRLNLAAALIHDPDTMLLDEPTVGVDPQSRNAIFENIRGLRERGKTILYTTHYMEEVERLCDRVIVIDGGRVIADETLDGLKRRVAAPNHVTLGLDGLGRGDWLADLRAVAGIKGADLSNLTLTLLAENLAAGLGAALEILGRHGVLICDISTHQPSLEDAFLLLTGRSLRD
jgi:ABC-2 type transport system ATP-binding protein